MKKTIYYIIFLSTLMMSSCSDWLDVKPSNNEEEEEMFSTETGFENALTGVYINMKSHQLYGRQLTMGMLEYMAQHWVANSSTTEGRYSNYDYEDAAVEESIKNIYAGLYNVLLNVNNLLRFVDNGVLSGEKHDL
uniref:RagB/SusD family nutrient uptake outer membrane protein n=1 Tax=Hoylesella enoeca TaxID=76123 RepID=UPI0035CEAEF2